MKKQRYELTEIKTDNFPSYRLSKKKTLPLQVSPVTERKVFVKICSQNERIKKPYEKVRIFTLNFKKWKKIKASFIPKSFLIPVAKQKRSKIKQMRLLYDLGRKTMFQQILVLQKKLVRIAFRLSYRSSVLEKFKDCKICTVFELHIYEFLKYSLSEIRNNFEIFDIGSQQKDTRNRVKTS